MSGWNSQGWNNPYGYPNTGGTGFGGGGFGGPRGPPPQMYNMWGPYGGNQMGQKNQLEKKYTSNNCIKLSRKSINLNHTLICMKLEDGIWRFWGSRHGIR